MPDPRKAAAASCSTRMRAFVSMARRTRRSTSEWSAKRSVASEPMMQISNGSLRTASRKRSTRARAVRTRSDVRSAVKRSSRLVDARSNAALRCFPNEIGATSGSTTRLMRSTGNAQRWHPSPGRFTSDLSHKGRGEASPLPRGERSTPEGRRVRVAARRLKKGVAAPISRAEAPLTPRSAPRTRSPCAIRSPRGGCGSSGAGRARRPRAGRRRP